MLQDLILSEYVELGVTSGYLVTFISAYYGPNADLFGNIQNDYWHYSAVEDVDVTILWILIFFSVDLGILFISSILLWITCNINVYNAYVELQKELGFG